MSFTNIELFCFNLHSFIEIDETFIGRFYSAVYEGDASKVIDMLDAGVPFDSVGWFGNTPLTEAASWNRTDVIRVLLQRRADVQKRNRYGYTALHWAVRNKSTDVIRLLMQHGASATVRDNFGTTPIDYASRLNCKEAIRIMEQH